MFPAVTPDMGLEMRCPPPTSCPAELGDVALLSRDAFHAWMGNAFQSHLSAGQASLVQGQLVWEVTGQKSTDVQGLGDEHFGGTRFLSKAARCADF